MDLEYIGENCIKKKKIVIDVIIPTFNNSKFILDAIRSILNQTYKLINIYVVDDSTNDDIYKIVKEVENVKYIRNPIRLGRVKNYKKCLYEVSTSDLLLILDGDDFLIENTYLEFVVNKFIEIPNLAFVYANVLVYSEKNNIYQEIKQNKSISINGIISGNDFFSKNLYDIIPFVHLSIIYNPYIARKLNFYSFNSIGCELESFFRLLVNNQIYYTNKSVGCWRKHDDNESLNVTNLEILNDVKYINSVYHYIKKNKEIKNKKKWRNKMIYNHLKYYYYIVSNDILKKYTLLFMYFFRYPYISIKFIIFIIRKKIKIYNPH